MEEGRLSSEEEMLAPGPRARAEPLPPVSVVMAVYNGERYVGEAIESVLRQTHRDFEFIVVDDHSTDGTREIVERYARDDGRIRLITNLTNVDQPASLNRGLAAARHEWVALLDADDACMPHRLETQLRALRREPSVRVLGSYAVTVDEHGNRRGIKPVGPKSVDEFKEARAAGLIFIVHPSAIMHRETILGLGGYDPRFGAAADAELWSRVADEHPVIALDEPLVYYRIHQNSMSVIRHFEQQLMLRWIRARQEARRRGLPEPDLDAYRRSEGGRFSPRRLLIWQRDWGQYLVVRSGLEWREGRRLRALLMRTIAYLLVPLGLRDRLKKRGAGVGMAHPTDPSFQDAGVPAGTGEFP